MLAFLTGFLQGEVSREASLHGLCNALVCVLYGPCGSREPAGEHPPPHQPSPCGSTSATPLKGGVIGGRGVYFAGMKNAGGLCGHDGGMAARAGRRSSPRNSVFLLGRSPYPRRLGKEHKSGNLSDREPSKTTNLGGIGKKFSEARPEELTGDKDEISGDARRRRSGSWAVTQGSEDEAELHELEGAGREGSAFSGRPAILF